MNGKGCTVDLPWVVDWDQAWLAPYREVGQRVWARWSAHGDLPKALNEERANCSVWPELKAGPLCFVPQDELAVGVGYEAFIHARAQVPTRHHLHDFFNGLMWLHWPAVKRCLNEGHAAASLQRQVPGTRGKARDVLTLFDENAAVWQAPAVLQEALRRRDWQALFVHHRAAWARSTLTLLGHALMEKLCVPRKPITAHVWLLAPDAAGVDAVIEQLQGASLAQHAWCPLPVLGVPGWWPANQDPSFYEDEAVFRPRRDKDAPVC